jgi:hypothetical protein
MVDNAPMSMTNTEKLVHYEQRLQMWEKTEEDIATLGQSYSIDDEGLSRRLDTASLPEVGKRINYYNNKIIKLKRMMNGSNGRIINVRGR